MRFSFGRNWLSYSKCALDQNKVISARQEFASLMRGIELRGARFLDIGFGQGLAVFFAAEAGADVIGIDVDPICAKALQATRRFFPSTTLPQIKLVSILDDEFVRSQQTMDGFDVVHSWGVLHHTGNMTKAFQNAASLVKPGGFLIISIYNRHWTSPFWRTLKYVFHHLPGFLQNAMVFVLYPFFYARARSLSKDGSPMASRGMDLRHDLRDWLGGYPYEYASPIAVQRFFAELGFRTVWCEPTKGFTGCNEFVFQKGP
jgi:2-polyprenyl-6-hydroxyphenyl methylase/3-demethylubiquinone-9 3-methyltransferase